MERQLSRQPRRSPTVRELASDTHIAVPHPVPYQGSKRLLASAILAYAPTRFARLVEPFAGSAAITLAAAARWPAAQFWLNDAHRPLAALWREIIARPARLADRYERLWHDQAGREREFFDDIRDEFNRTRQSEHLLYLLARCVKAAVRYNAAGQFNNTPDNRRRGTQPEAMRRRIRAASNLLARRTRVTGMDYRRVLAACQEDDLVYLDPPYQGVTDSRDRRYGSAIDHGELADQLAELNRRRCLFLVSYDGRTGAKRFGRPLPKSLRLAHFELRAGRSSQATLSGRAAITYESLYLSPALVRAIATRPSGQNARHLRLHA